MNHNANELRHVAAAQAPREDLYVTIHKAIRAMMADALLAVGRMDADDDLERAQVTERVMVLLDFCLSHLGHENEFVHPALEARAAGASERIAHEHGEHEQHIASLARSVAVLRDGEPAARGANALELYRALSLFVAENFQHMLVEETAHNAVLWARYTDAELHDIHQRLIASIPPAELMVGLRWMIPFLNPAERVMVLSGIRQSAPPPAFQAILEMVRPHLSAREWDKLEVSLRA
jgi:hypothetical protein